jgi:hypothetical protein
VVGAVPIVLAVSEVVFALIADQIVEREAIVAGDEVHARLRSAMAGLIEIAAPCQT